MREILHQRWPWGVAATLAVLIFLSQALEFRDPEADTRPMGSLEDIRALRERNDTNLLFVLVDTLRAGHLSSYGYERQTSPNLDAIAAHGVRFARHLAQSTWTKCSMASLWTAKYPVRTGVTRFNHVLPEEAVMPAEILSEAGFRVAGLWRNGWVDPSFGFQQGFDVYERPVGTLPPPTAVSENPTVAVRGTDFDLVSGTREFLRVYGKERWFVYLHMMDVHEFLYDEETAVFGTDNRDLYDNSVLRLDVVLGRLFDLLAETGHLHDTLVAIASDHGEAFGERGYEGHARALYHESTDVPLVLSFPFKLPEGVVVHRRTENVDLWPTLLDLLGLPPLPETDGRSRVADVLAAARGEPNGDAAFTFLDQSWGRQAAPQPAIAVARGPYRYVFGRNGRGVRAEELFRDEGIENVAAKEQDVVEQLRALAKEHLELTPAWRDTPELELDEMQLRQLRALGYSLP